ncbi:MAG: PspC domain-containing protein [Bacteroidia bacterium]|nr:PspC domain-containing protein [Bacteroidia bacterium]
MRRSRSNRVFAGVAGGLGEYFGVSPALIRFAFMIATGATSGMFFFIYLLMALIIPKNYDDWRNKNNK